jgi:hypothetical protein
LSEGASEGMKCTIANKMMPSASNVIVVSPWMA